METTKEINASPTKEFFISMLIRDITLNDAIGDLIDNSVDGALSLRPNRDYKGLKISITANENSFAIEDNCGGITYKTAKEYAFRFGRTSDTPTINRSVGQFGIGMKRALFKLGSFFEIESTSERESFKLIVDVDEWEKSPEWTFSFQNLNIKNIDDQDFPEHQRGTTIKVSRLNKEPEARLGLQNFLNELALEIQLEHIKNIAQGLCIEINGEKLSPPPLMIINTETFKPAYWEYEFDTGLKVKAIAGVSEDKLEYGGWYIFCNNRLILGPEQTITSGWGARKPDTIPKYHGQYQRFRGYIYFESEDPSLLPWTTSKNNIIIDSLAYTYVRTNMIFLMRPIIDFLNQLHKEPSSGEPEEAPITTALNISEKISSPIDRVFEQSSNLPQTFTTSVQSSPVKREKETRISYYRKSNKVEIVKQFLGVTNAQDVGKQTFDYFFENECEE